MSQHHKDTYYIKLAKQHGLRVSQGKGSHVKIEAPAGRGFMIVPAHGRDLPAGTECSIRKWFKALGIILAITAALVVAL